MVIILNPLFFTARLRYDSFRSFSSAVFSGRTACFVHFAILKLSVPFISDCISIFLLGFTTFTHEDLWLMSLELFLIEYRLLLTRSVSCNWN